MKTIILHGRLRRLFGEKFDLDINTPSEAIRALGVQIKGFNLALRKGEYHVMRGRRSLCLAETDMNLNGCCELHIVPATRGSKRQGILKVILGVALIGVGFAVAGWSFGGMANVAFGSITAGNLVAMGAGMLFNGLGQMLSPTPQVDTNEGAATRQSYIFTGAENVTQEGNIIPVVYGVAWSGSLVLSAGNDVEEVA